jgi:AcrR family transcriptional regulator
VGYKHSREEILEGALETAFANGLSRLSFGRVAKRLEIHDRVVVYYFSTKDELAAAVLLALGARLRETLAPAFTAPVADHLALARAAWPILARPDADRVFALFFEANGLAASGLAPYHLVVPELVEAWIDWTAGLLEGTDDTRRAEAAAAIALLDGLLLLRQLGGAATADRAARRLRVAT